MSRPFFDRLSQHFQRPAIKLWYFVEEQDTVVRQADLTRSRIPSAAHERRFGDRMVRRTKRACASNPVPAGR